MTDKKIALIDGYGFVFRAYHSLPPLTRKDGTPVGAVYGFTNMLIKLLAGLHVSHAAVVFDSGSKTFRNDIYPKYKANRPPCPEDLIPQFPIIREAAESLNLAILEKIGFEADDIIATLAKQYSRKDFDVLIVSSDKDLMQLVDDKVSMYDAMKNKMISPNEVKEKFLVMPDKVLDILALVGDSSDNVPGVKGIGPKTAAELINKYDNLENIFLNLSDIKQEKRRQILQDGIENARLSKILITLKEDVELGISENDLEVKNIEPHKLIKFLGDQGFRSLVERVKKEFNISQEIINQELLSAKKTEEIVKNKSENFSEIKKTKIINEEEFLKLTKNILASEIVIIDFEENFEELTNITLSTLKQDEELKEIFYFEIANLKKEENSAIDLFNFSEEKKLEGSLKNEFLVREIVKILENDSIKKIFFDTKRFLRLFLPMADEIAMQEGPRLITPKANIKSFEDVSLINHLLNSSIKNNFRELININLAEDIPSLGFDTIFNEVEKSRVPAEFEDLHKKQEFYSFKNFALWQLYKILYPKIFEQRLTNSYQTLEKPLISVLARMENIGVKIDIQKLALLSKEFEIKILELTKEIHQLCKEEFNIASTQQLSKILFEKMGLTSSKKSGKTGALSTKSSVLEELEAEGNEVASKILEFRKFSKLKNTYTDALPKEINKRTGRVHTNFSTTTTITGRLSSSNPNLQNIPIKTADGRKIRECFVAEKNNLLIAVDYSQIELRVIAHVAKIDALIQAFKEDKDIHRITAAQVFSLKEEDVTPEIRSKAKAINFGIIYGISGFGLAKQLKISRTEASEYIKNYFRTYPGIEEYMAKYKEFARQNGYVETIGGRKCFINGINDKNGMIRAEAERLAINAPIQGSAADIIKKAMIKLDKKLREITSNARIILQIHDELIIEAPENDAPNIAQIIKKEMENAMILDCLLKVDIEIGKEWK